MTMTGAYSILERHCFTAHELRNSHDALIPNHCGLGDIAVVHAVDYGHGGGGRKIKVFSILSCIPNDFTKWHRHALEVRVKAEVLLIAEHGKKMIFAPGNESLRVKG